MSLTRRDTLARLLAAAALLGPTFAQARDGADDRGPRDLPADMIVIFPAPGGGRFLPERIVLIDAGDPAGPALVAPLPKRATPTLASRIDLGAVPLAGELFTPRPATAYLEPSLRIGSAWRVGADLVATLDVPLERAALEQPLLLLTRGHLDHRAVSYDLPLAFSRLDPGAYDAAGAVEIGAAYAADGRLMIAPPRAELTGFDLQ